VEQPEVVSIYFAEHRRRYTLDLIDAYTTEVTKRVLPVFDQIEQEADDAAEQAWQETGNEGIAQERGFSLYSDLEFVREQVTGLAVAGTYHLWERLLKDFLVREYRHYPKPTKEEVFKADFPKLEQFLEEAGWPIKTAEFYPDLDRLRLVVNVIKHGDGKSCKELLEKAPDMFFNFEHPWPNASRGASHLSLKREHFPRFTSVVCEFFQQFPERLPPL
jgi:hypothetical protein